MYNGSFCDQKSQFSEILTEPLNPRVGGNREMDRVYKTSQVSNIQGKQNVLTIVDMFSKMNIKV